MRPTTKDLANAAGVSLATIDRVLNERPGVKPHTIEKVNAAINEIGFVRNLSAANLARNKIYNLIFVLPLRGDFFLKELLLQIETAKKTFAAETINIHIQQVEAEDPHGVAFYLSKLDQNKIDGIAIMIPESPQSRDALKRLHERNIKVVQLFSGKANSGYSDIVGIDNYSAGATAGALMGKFRNSVPGKIAIIADTMLSTDSIQRRLGFDKIINEKFPTLSTLPSLETHSDLERTNQIVENIFNNHSDITGIYILSSEPRLSIEAINKFSNDCELATIAHERTVFTENALRNDTIDAIIAQNPGHAIRSAVRILKARSDKRDIAEEQDKIRIEILIKENL